MKSIKVITAIQKLGKPKGTIENLLSMLRKVLAICLKKRIIYKLGRGEVPPNMFSVQRY